MNEGVEPASITLAKKVRSINPLFVVKQVWLQAEEWQELMALSKKVLEEWSQK